MKDVYPLLSLKGKKKKEKESQTLLLRLSRRSQRGKHVGVQTKG